MASQNRISTLIASQLPGFIRDEHPVFVEFLEKYYEFLEQPGYPVYELKKFEDNYNVDTARESLLKYFKSKILPSFPETTNLSTERIIKAARDFYAKKGTPDSFNFLFKTIYGQDVEVFFPKLQILRASDGKWILPQAFRLTLSDGNQGINLNLIEKRKAYGSLSRASCVIERAYETVDRSTGREIVEIYVSNVNRLFQNGEYLEVNYTDGNGVPQVFSEKIIGALSNIAINPNRRGRKYVTGDPVVINGGLDLTSGTRVKAIAEVGNVTTGSIDSITVLDGGYGFRQYPDSIVEIITSSGVGANVIVSDTDEANGIAINYATDSILFKKNAVLNTADYSFANVALANISTSLSRAFSFSSFTLSPIVTLQVVNGGSFFTEEPILDVISLYDSDYSTIQGSILVPAGNTANYINTVPSFQLVGGAYSSENGYYNGFKVRLEKQHRSVVDYIGATKTVVLNRPFEQNITNINFLSKNLYLDSRPNIRDMGRIAKVKINNGGSGYSASDTVVFTGTGTSAAATLTVSGTGVITDVTLTNRGEGYPAAPTVSIVSATGTGGALEAVLFSDGEEFDVVTTDIGQIRDFTIINRGSDYVTTPNVSLKIYDLYVTGLGENTINENELVFQGTSIANTTFRGTVDSYSNNVLRVFNYSGSPLVSQNLTVVKADSANINVTVQPIIVGGKEYPYRYGDGRAKANAEFLNGLIKFNGYYLNTDGHLSSDKKIQDGEKYHNFSYEIISEVQYTDYRKTIADVAHPSGAKLIPIYVINDNKDVSPRFSSNNFAETAGPVGVTLTMDRYESANAFAFSTTNTAIFPANSYIVFGPAGRQITKQINTASYVTGPVRVVLDGGTSYFGNGRLRVTSNSNSVIVSGNTSVLAPRLATNDFIKYQHNYFANNVLRYSQDLTQAAVWQTSEVSVSGTLFTAPDGTTTANKITESINNNYHFISNYVAGTFNSNRTYTFSAYLKAAERNFAMLKVGSNPTTGTFVSYTFNLTTGAISGVSSAGSATGFSASATNVGNGWWRCSITMNLNTADTAMAGQIFIASTFTTNPTYGGTLNNGIYVWGVQLESSPNMGEYAPTTATANVIATTATVVNYTANVISVTGNVLTLNTMTHLLTSNSANVPYVVYPRYDNVAFSIIRT